FAPLDRDRISVAADALIEHLKTHQLARDTVLFLPRQNGAAEKGALAKFADPAKARFERRGFGVNLVPVQAHPRFEAQRVPRAEPAGNHPGRFARAKQVAPQFLRELRIKVDFESILTRVARPRDQTLDSADAPENEVIVRDEIESRASKLLKNLFCSRALNRQLRISQTRVLRLRVNAIMHHDVAEIV